MEPEGQNPQRALAAIRQTPLTALAGPEAGAVVDCWNQIGVAGDGTCGELLRVVHCRNCPVYAAAGARLLDRPMPADYRREWTEILSREKKQVSPGWKSVVIFRLGAEWLALPTDCFQEIIERRPVHSLPHRRNGTVLGLVNVRGELQICVSMAKTLGIKPAHAPEGNRAQHERMVVAEWEGGVLAFPVDEIQGIHRYQPEDLKPLAARAEADFLGGVLSWREQWVGCLDAGLLFSTLNRSLL